MPHEPLPIGHTRDVEFLVFARGDSLLVTAAADHTLKVWNVHDRRLVRSLQISNDPCAVAVSPDGRWVAAGWLHEIAVWDARSWARLRPPREPSRRYTSPCQLGFTMDGRLAATSGDSIVEFWETATGEPSGRFRTGRGRITATIFAPLQDLIVTRHEHGVIRIWNARGELRRELLARAPLYGPMAVAAQAPRLAALDGDSLLKVWDVETGRVLVETRIDAVTRPTAMALSSDGESLAVMNYSGDLVLSPVAGGATPLELEEVGETAAFSSSGALLATADEQIRLLDPRTGEQRALLGTPFRAIQGVAVDSAVDRVLVAYPDAVAAVPTSGGMAVLLHGRIPSLSPTGRIVAIDGSEGMQLHALANATAAPVPLPSYFAGPIVFADSADLAAFETRSDDILIVHTRTGAVVDSLGTGEDDPQALALTRDGRMLAYSTQRGETVLWDVQQRTRKTILPAAARRLVFSPDGSLIAASADGPIVEIWRTDDAERIVALDAGTQTARALAFTADAASLATSGEDHVIKLWSTRDWELRRRFDGHSASVNALAFVSADQRLVSAGDDGTVRIWDVATGRQVSLLLPTPGGEWLAGGAGRSVELTGDLDREWASRVADALGGELASTGPGDEGQLRSVLRAVPSSVGASAAAPGIEATSRPELIPQVPHHGGITSVAFSPRGDLLATASDQEMMIRLWDVRSGLQIRSLASAGRLPGGVSSLHLDFSPDGARLSVSGQRSVELWDIARGVRLREIKGTGPAFFSADGSAVLHSNYLRIDRYGLEDGEARVLLETGVIPIVLDWSADRSRVVMGNLSDGWDRYEVSVWDLHRDSMISTLDLGNLHLADLAMESSGERVVTCHSRAGLGGEMKPGLVVVWDALTGRRLRELELEGDPDAPDQCHTVAFDPAGRRLAVGTNAGALLVDLRNGARIPLEQPDSSEYVLLGYNARTGAVHHAWGMRRHVTALAFTPDGELVAGGTSAGKVRLWSTRDGRLVRNASAELAPLSSAAVSGTGEHLVVAHDAPAALWNLRTGELIRRYGAADHRVVAMSPDSRFIAAGDAAGYQEISIFDLAGERRAHIDFESYDDSIRSIRIERLKYTADGRLLIGAGNTGSGSAAPAPLILWDAGSGEIVATLPNPASIVYGFDVSADGRILAAATGGDSAFIGIWDVDARRLVARFGGLGRTLALSPDGTLLAVEDGRDVVLWDVATGLRRGRLESWRSEDGRVSALRWSPDGSVLAAGHDSGTLRFWDLANELPRRTDSSHGGEITELLFDAGGTRLISASADGTARLWAGDERVEVAAFMATGERRSPCRDGDDVRLCATDYITVAPDGYYRASKAAMGGIAFRIGARAFPFHQFDLSLNRPDIVLRRLGSRDTAMIKAFALAHEQRLARLGLDSASTAFDAAALPTLSIERSAVPVATAEPSLRLSIVATSSDAPLERIEVVVNGVPAFGSAGLAVPPGATELRREVEVPLSAGPNAIEIFAVEHDGSESLRETLSVVHTGPAPAPELYIILVGVSSYADSTHDLTYPAKDARDLAAFFAGHSDRFAAVHVDSLFNEKATRENILALRERLMRSRVDDQVVLFVAGHGLLDDRLQYFFGTHDIDFADPAERGVPYAQLEGLLDGVPARKKLLLIDTCHAGEVDPSVAAADATTVAGAAATTERPNTEPRLEAAIAVRELARSSSSVVATQRDVRDAPRLLQELFTDLTRGTGAVVIAAAGGAEFAFESDRWRNGVFTFAVREGLDGAADVNRDGTVSVLELREYVAARVTELTHGRQRPVTRRENAGLDFPVY